MPPGGPGEELSCGIVRRYHAAGLAPQGDLSCDGGDGPAWEPSQHPPRNALQHLWRELREDGAWCDDAAEPSVRLLPTVLFVSERREPHRVPP